MASTAKRNWRFVALFVCWALAGVPATAILTLALLPLWRVVETHWGIESVGHSGPADWCFELVYVVWLVLGGVTFWTFSRRSRRALPT